MVSQPRLSAFSRVSSHEQDVYARRQQTQGLLPQGTNFDLFRGTAQGARDEIERYPTQVHYARHPLQLALLCATAAHPLKCGAPTRSSARIFVARLEWVIQPTATTTPDTERGRALQLDRTIKFGGKIHPEIARV